MIDSSIWKSVSSPRDLIPCSSAVAMFMCVSRVCFRAVNSGRAVIAALRFAAFDDRSLQHCCVSIDASEQGGMYSHLREVVDISHTGRTSNLSRVGFVSADVNQQ